MHPQIFRVRHHLLVRTLPRLVRSVRRDDLIRLGTDYGGWWVPSGVVAPGKTAYCGGAGEDISFDLALLERGCRVVTFDPTPRAIAHVEQVAPSHERFHFEPVGWWSSATTLKFYAPKHPDHVSHSALNLQGTTTYFEAEVKPVRELMTELGDQQVDLIKMDIEGAEYEVIDSLLSEGPQPSVLCIEFDQPQPLRRTLAAVKRIQGAGYQLNKIEGFNFTFTRP